MKRSTAVMFMCLVFALAALAQTSGSTNQDQNPPGSSASSDQNTGNSANSGAMSGQSGSMNDNMGKNHMKGEKTLKGCIQSDNGKYMLEEKNDKMAMLKSSEDLSAHVGHEVKVHGMWQNSMSADTSAGGGMSNSSGNMSGGMSSGKADHAGEVFMVSKLDMVSDTCKMGMRDHSKMDHQKPPMSEQPQQ